MLATCAANKAYTPPDAPTNTAFMSNTLVPKDPAARTEIENNGTPKINGSK